MIVAWNGGQWGLTLAKGIKPASETDPLQQVLHCTEQVGPFQGPDILQFEHFSEPLMENANKTCSSLLILLRAMLTVDCG